MGKIQIDYTKVESYVLIQSTVKPVLKATSEQRPPVYNDHPESSAQLNQL
jgi:hypothetical protein